MNIEIKNIIEAYLLEATLDEDINPIEISKEGFIEVQKTTNELHGDYYSNIAMKLSKVLKKNPMERTTFCGIVVPSIGFFLSSKYTFKIADWAQKCAWDYFFW